jgi:hypothetical protein
MREGETMNRKLLNMRPYETTIMMSAVMVMVVALCLGGAAKAAGPTKDGVAPLPSNLFIGSPPSNAIGIGEARKSAQEGKPIAIKGRIGGTAKPIADKYAMFLMTDLSLPLCKDGCADFCNVPRKELLEKVATVQVVDGTGRPIRSAIEGVNGVKPLAEVVIQGTVAKLDANMMLINAQNIYVHRITQ